jgi:hypothetical protein
MFLSGEVHVLLRAEPGREVRRVVADRWRAGDRETGRVDVAREQFDADVPAERPTEYGEPGIEYVRCGSVASDDAPWPGRSNATSR